MADHLQDQILASLKASIVAGEIVPPESVYLEGVDEIPADAAPAIKIDCGPEAVDVLTLKFPRTLKRTLDIVITAVVAQNGDYRVRAGGMLASLERALQGTQEARSAGGIAPEGLRLIATDPDRDGNAARVVYSIRSLWRIPYLAKEAAPDRPVAA